MRFRRRRPEDGDAAEADVPGAGPAPEGPRGDGPWDVSEVTVEEDDPATVDLGSLIVTGRPGLEVQLQVDETSGEVMGVVLAGEDGAVELRPFAAPRNGEVWTEIRRAIAADVSQHGGTADEGEGPWGPELRVVMPVTMPDGQPGTQVSRVLGIEGPRWLLRATLFGRPALEPSEEGEVESALREVIVVRGGSPLPPGDPLPMTLPANAERIDFEE